MLRSNESDVKSFCANKSFQRAYIPYVYVRININFISFRTGYKSKNKEREKEKNSMF